MKFLYRAMFLIALTPVYAHNFSFTDVSLTLVDGRFEAVIICDLDALALGVPAEAMDSAILNDRLRGMSPEEVAEIRAGLVNWLERRARIRFDDTPTNFAVAFPEEGEPVSTEGEPSYFGVKAVLSGDIPETAQDVSFFLSRAFPAVKLTLIGPAGPVGDVIALAGGARSDAFQLDDLQPPSQGAVFWQYIVLGFYHILPLGLDHILFVLALFLFTRSPKPLILQVSAFTLAHTITLGLAASGIVSLPSKPVEILIAASIVYAALENVFSEELKPHRLAIVFGFGLLHGLGFAGVLGELGLPSHAFATALVGFNLGVEFGQLAVIGLAYLALGWFIKRDFYRPRIVKPLSWVIAAVGLFWVVERLIG